MVLRGFVIRDLKIKEGKMAQTSPPSKLFRNMSAKVAAIPMILTALVIFVGCTVWSFVYSFTKSRLLPKKLFSTEDLFSIPVPTWLVKDGSLDFYYITGFIEKNFVGLKQYDRLWHAKSWLIAVDNLAFYAGFSLVVSLVLGFVLAAFMDQKIRFENTFRTIFLYPYAMSAIITGLVWQWILNPTYGLEKIVHGWGWESFEFAPLQNPDLVMLGVLIAGSWQGTGFIMALMLAGLRGIDEDIWKAARIDGIPTWKTYIKIVIPMMRPVFVTTLVLITAGILKVYDLIVAQTGGGPGLSSQVPAMYVYTYLFGAQNLGQGLAASTMMLVSVLVILIPWAIIEFGGKEER